MKLILPLFVLWCLLLVTWRCKPFHLEVGHSLHIGEHCEPEKTPCVLITQTEYDRLKACEATRTP